MEKHKCKLCLRNFSNGRALGGHMRSHMVNLPVPPKLEEPPPPPLVQLSFEAESAPSSSSSSSSEEEEEEDDKALCYGLRENPKRSFRLVDPDFSFPVQSASVVLQDRESETESSKNPTRTRSKRACNNQFHHHQKKMKPSNDHHHNHHHPHNKNNKTESSWVEPEPVSSISDATTEEDVAFCLMMLSRDKWKRQEEKYEEEEDEEQEEEDEEEEEEDDEEDDDDGERSVEDSDEFYEEMKSSKTRSVRGKYKCETCNKVFRSYQALGGHRASHKKIKPVICEPEIEQGNVPMAAEKKIHECPVCFRVFASGQALGGHKRTHVTGSAIRIPPTKFGDNNSLIDLNLPAQVDEDEISQIENSAVSDAEFLKHSSQIIGAQLA
ncbi:zinc finger protein ZAT9-like [Neltuma alba]|uniref:zinc finger protein ZAT9-like n=1 Tax=Neltuma alba TaxID=207710 RepID=UPI0010A49C3D|nr:zinc finger protein ZAT9-like [Prosopis alba]